MTSPVWQRSDGELLKALREKAGLDPVVLARMGTMTVKQLRGLEEGEGGEFYSPAIKAHMGRVLLAKLGYVAPVPAPEPVTQVSVASAPENSLPAAPVLAPAPGLSGPKPGLVLRLPRQAWVALACAGLIMIGVGFLFAPRASSHKPPVQEPVAGALPADGSVLVAHAAPPLPVVVAAPAPVPAATSSTPPSADPACAPGQAGQGLAYTPSEPRKAGNFVHLVADKPVRLCVLDASQKATRLELEPGVGRSVPGAAPFVVQGELAHLKIFFQGVRVQGDLAAGTQVVLNEAPLR